MINYNIKTKVTMDILDKAIRPVYESPPGSDKYTMCIMSKDLIGHLQLPDIQRECNPKHVKYLKETINNDYGIIILAEFKNTLYIIDGQHRYQVMNQSENTEIQLTVKRVKSQNEMDNYFVYVNNSFPSKIFKNSNQTGIYNGLRKYFQNTFPKFLSTANKPRRPNISLDGMIDMFIEYRFLDDYGNDLKFLIECINDLNIYYKTMSIDKWKITGIKDIHKQIEQCRGKSPTNPLFLGIFGRYEWVPRLKQHLYDKVSYNDMSHVSMNKKRKRIPKRIRKIVWMKRNENSISGSCYVCKSNIEYDSFECGHIVSVFWGGENIITNLEPICSVCNNDIGIDNLEIYKKAFETMQ